MKKAYEVMLSELLDYLFPMRDEYGATLTLFKICIIVAVIPLWYNRELLLAKMRTLVSKIKLCLRVMPAWLDCKITDASCRPRIKASVLIALSVITICGFFVVVYNYVFRPIGKFWEIRIPWIRQLHEAHSQFVFWAAFVVYCIICIIVCLRWRKYRWCHVTKSGFFSKIVPGHDAPLSVIPSADRNRASFVKVLTEAVAYADVRNEAEFIGIYGVWGKGKTTIVNSFKNNVLSGGMKCCGVERLCVVNFNPMEFHNSDDALAALFKEIVARLISAYRDERIYAYYYLAKAFKAYSTNLYLRRVKLELGTIGEMLEIVRQWFYLHVFRAAESKRRLSDALQSESIRLVLIVDDLERMPFNDVPRILNFLKANLDLPNVVVLVLSDEEHLCRSMAASIGHENASDADKVEAGKEYLEKFIQRTLEVPGFSREMIIDYFKSKLPEVLMDVKAPEYEDDFATLADFAITMRQVNKILGRMWATVRYYFHHEGQDYLPYHIGDLAALTAVAEFEPRVFQNLRELIQMVRPNNHVQALNTGWGVPEQFVTKWIDENVVKKEHKQYIQTFLADQLLFVKGKNNDGEVIYRIDNDAIHAGNYSFRLVAPLWTDMYFRDFSRKVSIEPDELSNFGQSMAIGNVPVPMLQELINDNKLELFLDILLGQPEFKTDEEFVTFIKTMAWLSNQKYSLRFFSNPSAQGFYASTIFMAIYRVWLSYWTRIVKPLPIARKRAVDNFVVEVCKSSPACHFIRQLLSSDHINHKKEDHNSLPELCMFSDEQYEELVDLYLDAIEELQSKDKVFDDPCYLDLVRAWNISLIRREDDNRYNKFRQLIETSLGSIANILKLRLFYIRSVIDAGDGEEIVDGVYFTGVDLKSVERIFGLQLLRTMAARLNEAFTSLSLDDKILSAALTFVVMMDLDSKKCSAEQQFEYLRDAFSPQEKPKSENGTAKTMVSLRADFIRAVTQLDFTQQLAALGLAYQVRAVEKRDDTIELGHGLYVQTHNLIMKKGGDSIADVYCPVFVYDDARMVLNEAAANEEYLSASLHVSHNYLVPLAKSICGHEGNTCEAFELFVKQNNGLDPSRIGQCAKALYYGAQGDYSSAAQLLIPQIEHLIRGLLKANFVQEPKGARKGLGALLYASGIERVMSKVVLFELRALFMARHNGLNIRNLFAHGELPDQQASGLESFYIWWFFVRMVVNLRDEPMYNLVDVQF